ncbi:hypothetical protein RJ639_034837 [Escallonia herrerae]|uniref:CCHC-type domain-containing protein n=1 Tax=Escallonia herrerae TaxID=1293975 RepID=A0AA88WWG7_9ASTE|nr:hypothetical protein RJ639_034837 [Escallonia herrerae]
MIAKNFKKFMRFRRNGGRRQQNVSNEEKLCYKCHKPGHMKMDCPIYKREKKERRDVWERVKRRQLSKKENKEKEKAMNAKHTPTWSDFDSKNSNQADFACATTRLPSDSHVVPTAADPCTWDSTQRAVVDRTHSRHSKIRVRIFEYGVQHFT